jgi:hypothetical protein
MRIVGKASPTARQFLLAATSLPSFQRKLESHFLYPNSRNSGAFAKDGAYEGTGRFQLSLE